LAGDGWPGTPRGPSRSAGPRISEFPDLGTDEDSFEMNNGCIRYVAGKVEIHEMMKMRQVEKRLEIDPGKTVKLSPGGYHLMLMDLKTSLKEGDKLSITLEFEKAGKVTVTFDAESVGARGPGGASGEKMEMKKMDMKKM
jgi:hypothetical protein